ncbi:MAG: head-tail connector protein [Parvibaculum sp.]|uniref:head-tail connector protein n=1 Tax=Parvibaculum sp. TaxID=2024848 RepID=UPI0032660271
MTLTLIEGPAAEPVSLAEARAHLKLDATEEDALLGALVTAARTLLEAETRRAFLTQRWQLTLDEWPAGALALPLAPVASVIAVKVAAMSGAMIAIDPGFYEVDAKGEPPRLAAKRGQAWPMPATRLAGISVDFEAGYGTAADVPMPLRQAVLLLAAHWFENREPVGDGVELPLTVSALIARYRRHRL